MDALKVNNRVTKEELGVMNPLPEGYTFDPIEERETPYKVIPGLEVVNITESEGLEEMEETPEVIFGDGCEENCGDDSE